MKRLSLLKKVGFVVAGVLVLLLAALMIVPRLVPDSVYRERIESAATAALGRKVTVSGKINISIFPRIEARAGAATIANPEGFGDAPFASMNELRASVKLIPLLFRRVEIDEFVLVDPTIALVALEDGRNNWTFPMGETPPPEPAPTDTASPPAPDAPPSPPATRQPFGASLRDVRIVNGRVSYENRANGQLQTLSELGLKAQMRAIDQPFRIEATGKANDQPFEIKAFIQNPRAMIDSVFTPVEITLKTDVLETSLRGQLAMGDDTRWDLAFEGVIPSGPALADRFKIANLPGRAALGRVSLSGQTVGTPSDILLNIADARHESPMFNANFNGQVRFHDQITVQGTATADAPKLADLAAAMNTSSPGSAALGAAHATMKVSGRAGDLIFTDIDFRHEGALSISFQGGARLTDDLTYNGHVAISTDDLRALASKAGTQLPPGNVYRRFALSGDTSGGTRDVLLDHAVVEFDSIRGTGRAALTFTGRPKLTGELATNLIDITGYAVASGAPPENAPTAPGGAAPAPASGGASAPQQPAPATAPWGNTPINLTPLRLVDADLTLRAEGVKFQKFEFGRSNLLVTLRDGKLQGNLTETSLFGGGGVAILTADATAATPAVSLNARFRGVAARQLLAAAARFEMVDGKADVDVNVGGSGATLQTLMNSLAGDGSLKFADGAVRGVDLTRLVNVTRENLARASILNLTSSFGANSRTAFDGMTVNFTMKDGLAATNDLKFNADSLTMAGGGWLDLGGQKLGLSLFPEFRDRGQGVDGYGLPLKVSGGWTGVRFEPDFGWLRQRVVSGVRTRAETEVQNLLRDQLGGRFSGLLGQQPAAPQPAPSGSPAPSSSPAPATSPTPAPSASPSRSAEDSLREEGRRALRDLLRRD
jgi:AsmA protein